MNKIKSFFIKNRNRFIIIVSSLLIFISLMNIYFTVEVNVISNDECLWLQKQDDDGQKVIIFDLVKVNGVTWNAGIRNGDKLLAINDVPVKEPLAAQAVLNQVSSGEFATYTVERNGEIFSAQVYIKKLFWFGQLAQAVLSLIFMVIGFIVLMAKPDGIVQKLFYGIGAASVFVSSIFIVQQDLRFEDLSHLNVIKILLLYLWLLSMCFLPFLIIYFFWIFPRPMKILEKKWVKPLIFIIPGVLFVFGLAVAFFTFVFKALSFQFYVGTVNLLGNLTPLAYIVGYISLIVNYRRLKTKEEKRPILVILSAFTLAILAITYTGFVAPAITDVIFNAPEFYTPIILIVLFPLAFGYSIFKYQLMDVSVVVRNAIIYGSATITVLIIYFLVIYLLGQTISRAIGTEYQAVIAGVAFIIFALVFQSTKDKFQDFLTERFYPEQFAYQKVLIRFSNEVSTLIGLDNILDSMRETHVNAMKIDKFGILLYDNHLSRFRLVRQKGLSVTNLELKAPGLVKYIKDRALLSQPPAVDQLEFSNVFPEKASTLINQDIHTVIPMIIKSKVIGLLLFGLKHSGSRFSGKDIELMTAAANQCALAIENARLYETEAEKNKIERDLELARKIQQGLLPRCIPEINGLDICGQMIPAQQVGGDYFDLIPVSDDKIFVVVGDVSGKGLPASLYMSKLQTMVQLSCTADKLPREVMIDINKKLSAIMEPSWFVTMSIGLFDSSSKTLVFCRAGHVPLIVTENGSVSTYRSRGLGIGLEKGEIFNRTIIEETIPLKAGQIYAFYSDGITEAMNSNDEEYGEERLSQILVAPKSNSASDISDEVLNSVSEFAGGRAQYDDMTLVLVKVMA